MPPRRLKVLVVVAIAAAAAVPGSSRAAPPGFITASGERLMLNGSPWRAVGVNFWDMDAGKVLSGDITGCWYQHADLDAYLDSSFRTIAQTFHATAVRTFGFRAMYTAGGTDWSSTDKLLYYAQKYNVRVIPVFGDQYGACGTSAKDAAWYLDGYKTHVEQPWGIDYRSYVVRVVQRYKDNPTIAFWQLMNEATAGSTFTALQSFSRDMVSAIRTDAGDANHLVNLGTVGGGQPGNELPGYSQLLDCAPAAGGCNDLAEVHVFDAATPLPGLPMPSSVDVVIDAWNDANQHRTSGAVKVPIDGWGTVTLALPGGPQQPYTHWALRMSGPAATGLVAYLDDATVTTTPAPQLYTFETGTEGFTASGATIATTVEAAHGGLQSLRAALGAGSSTATFTAPAITGTPSQIDVSVRVNFRAPAPDAGASMAADQHAAVVSRVRPFVVGEAGYKAAVPGVADCNGMRSLQSRADAFNAMMTTGMDAAHGGAGLLVWDFKDPTVLSTHPSGAQVTDQTLWCWSVTPTDPAAAVIRTWADQTPNSPALPVPPALPAFAPRMTALTWPNGEVGFRNDVRFKIRLTQGGSAMRGARLVAGNGCFGSGTTDALGLADFTCQVNQLGALTITVSPDPATCEGCSVAPLQFPVTSKRSVTLTAKAGIVERGNASPLTLVIEDPRGASVQGIAWSVPECGASGVVAGAGPRAEITASCPTGTAWKNPQVLRFRTAADAGTIAAETPFVGMAFDRVYVDERTGDCVGFTPSTRWIGVTKRAGLCGAGDYGSVPDWIVPGGPVAGGSFQAAGPSYVVNADMFDGRSVRGAFQFEGGRAFSAVVVRPNGVAALASP
jgi:hypothetical protein